jgi:hypothetical protein
MWRSIRYLVVIAALSLVPEIAQAQDEGGGSERRAAEEASRRETRQIQQQQEANQRAYEAHRRQINEFLRNPLGIDSHGRFTDEHLEQLRLNASRDDVIRLAENLQRLHDLGRAPIPDEGIRNEIKELSQESREYVEKLLDFVNLGIESPPGEPIAIPNQTTQERTTRAVELFRGFLTPLATLILGDVFDLKMLEQTRSDLALMHGLIQALPESEMR